MAFWDGYQTPTAPVPQQTSGGPLDFIKNALGGAVGGIARTGQNIISAGSSFGANDARQKAVTATLQAQKKLTEDRDAGRIGQEEAARKINELNSGLRVVNKEADKQAKPLQEIDPLKAAADATDTALTVGTLGAAGLVKGAVQTGLKAAIGKATIKDAIKRGVGEGAVYSGAYGALRPIQEKGKDVTGGEVVDNALTSALVGGLVGGGLGGALNVGSKITGKAGGVLSRKTPDGTVKPSVRSKIADVGTAMEARAGGFGVGEENAGKQLGFYDSKAIGDSLSAEGIRGGSPTARLKQVEDKLQQYGKDIDTAIKSSNTSLTETERHQIATQFMDALEHTPGVTQGAIRHGKQEVTTFLNSKSGDLKGVVDFKRGLDKNAINYRASTDAATGDRQLASTVFRDTLKNAVNERAPDLQALNDSYHNLSTASGFLKGGSKAIADMSQGQGGSGIISRVLSGEPAESAKSKLGSVLKRLELPKAPAQKGQPVVSPEVADAFGPSKAPIAGLLNAAQGAGILGTITRQGVGRAVSNDGSQPSDTTPTPDEALSDWAGGGFVAPIEGTSDAFSKGNVQNLIIQDLQKNGGKNIATLLKLYDTFGKKAEGQKFNSTAAGNISDFQSSLSELGNLRDFIDSGKGTTDPILGRLRSLNPYDTDQQTLQALIDKTRQIVGKALEGGVLRKEDEEKYKKILPTTSDTKDVALAKIDAIQKQLALKSTNYTSIVGGGTTLEDLAANQAASQ
jgi:hypothetical protein